MDGDDDEKKKRENENHKTHKNKMCTNISKSQQQVIFPEKKNTHKCYVRGQQVENEKRMNLYILPLVLYSTFLCIENKQQRRIL